MKTLLLLAGRSTRFWPLSDKTLFPLCGMSLLEHQMEMLRSAGCDDVLIVGGAHNIAAIQSLYADVQVVEQEHLEWGMRGALLSALPHCGTEPVLIVSGNDAIESSGYKAVLHAASTVDGGALLARTVEEYFPGGYLTVNGDRVTGIVEKPGEGNEPSNLVNIVAHVHNDASRLLTALQEWKSADADGAYETVLHNQISSLTYKAVPYTGTWQPVKYPWHMLQLLETILGTIKSPQIHPTAEIHETAVIDGPVIIEEGVKVLPHATVRGPCFIGAHSIIANNALVRNASVGEHCVVGFCTEVKSSVLHSHVWTHMTYIGDSLVDRNVSFGSGCVTGNFRLDESSVPSAIKGEMIDSACTKLGACIGPNVRLGIQVGMNPGVKIGGGSFIAGGTYVSEDLPDKSFARMKNGTLTVSDNREEPQSPEARSGYREKVE